MPPKPLEQNLFRCAPVLQIPFGSLQLTTVTTLASPQLQMAFDCFRKEQDVPGQHRFDWVEIALEELATDFVNKNCAGKKSAGTANLALGNMESSGRFKNNQRCSRHLYKHWHAASRSKASAVPEID